MEHQTASMNGVHVAASVAGAICLAGAVVAGIGIRRGTPAHR